MTTNINVNSIIVKDAKYYVTTPDDQMSQEDLFIKDKLVDKTISKVLERKYGIKDKLLIFQEDIMALCSYGAGFSLGDADSVRKAMGKKNMALMLSFEPKFKSGWNENVGIFADEVWAKMVDYAKYCFNKSHAVAYTLVTLKTAELQEYYFDQYMGWNYKNLDAKMKEKAAKLMEERSPKRFPTFKNPYRGITFGKDIEFNSIELTDEQKENFKTEYNYLSELFMTNDIDYKAKFILRGLYDSWTKDILGLVNLKKKLGKKADFGEGLIPDTNIFKDFLSYLVMKGYIRVEETEGYYSITNKVKKEPEEKDWIRIYKSIEYMPEQNRIYRVRSLIKEFGVSKSDDYDTFPENINDKIKNITETYDKIFNRFIENNQGKVITRNVYNLLIKKAKSAAMLFEAVESKLGIKRARVADINIMKNGTCKITLQFKNMTRVFYTKDPNIKVGTQKNDIINVNISIYTYQGRDKYLKALLELKKA